MYSLFWALLSLTVFFNSGYASVSDTIASGVVINKVQATLDLTTHIAKYSAAVTVENSGSGDQKAFLFAIHSNFSKQLSFFGASVSTKEGDSKLTVKETSVSTHKDKYFFRVELKEALGAGKQVTVQVQAIFPHSLRPYPSHITQSEKQYVEYIGNALFYSPYKTVSQTLTVKCASSNIIAHTKVSPSTSSESSITYGPYENKDAFSEAAIVIHYENNTPFLAVTSMTRLIEVSHWGNIAVEETMDVRHTGAVLKGPFSRYDYQRGQDSASSVKSFKMILPASARDVYYRDEIGNISTSHLLELEDSVEVELRPRFPLFGGWKTHYTLGYNVPSYQYLYHTDDNFVLKMRFVDHIFDDQVVDDITLRVILPEGAKDIRLVTPFNVERRDNELHYTYLDTVGRPVVIARKNNLVEQHIVDFELHYKFPRVMMLQEPLLLIGAFYLLFLVVIVYVRLDFAITKDEVGESRMKVASLVEQVLNTQVRRSALYQSYDDAVNKFKASKDSTSFVTQRKKIDTDHKQLTQQIATVLAKLKTEGSDAADKVATLQSLDQQLKELVTSQAQNVEKLVANKVTKQQYLDAEKVVENKKKDLTDKIEAVQQQLS